MSTTPPPTPAPKRRRTSTTAFTRQGVALAQRPGMTFMRAASDVGINESMLRTWSHQAEAEGRGTVRGHGVRTEEASRIAAREREVRILREERAIQKAMECVVKERR